MRHAWATAEEAVTAAEGAERIVAYCVVGIVERAEEDLATYVIEGNHGPDSVHQEASLWDPCLQQTYPGAYRYLEDVDAAAAAAAFVLVEAGYAVAAMVKAPCCSGVSIADGTTVIPWVVPVFVAFALSFHTDSQAW